MKKIMEMLQNMKAKNEKKDNKGFSLVELIIVIAIMAILVGIVGTQVLPYINKSREAKDLQIINSFGTAATTAYSSNAETVTGNTTVTIDDNAVRSTDALTKDIVDLTSFTSITDLTNKMGSKDGKKIAKIEIVFDIKDVPATESTPEKKSKKTITTQAYDSSNNPIFDPVVTQL